MALLFRYTFLPQEQPVDQRPYQLFINEFTELSLLIVS